MAAASGDWLLRFLQEFASLPEEQRDAAIDALSAQDRDELVTFADARTASAAADLMAILDAGQGGLDNLYEVGDPADLLAVITLAVREHPDIVVEALFADVVLHRRWNQHESGAIVALRERWHWHVYEQIAAAQARAQEQARGHGEGAQPPS